MCSSLLNFRFHVSLSFVSRVVLLHVNNYNDFRIEASRTPRFYEDAGAEDDDDDDDDFKMMTGADIKAPPPNVRPLCDARVNNHEETY